MKQTDRSVVNVFRSLRSYLSIKDFNNNLSRQLPSYDVSIDFLYEFLHDVTTEIISKQSLTSEAMVYLIDNDKFDYNIWKENVEKKNIDIIMDTEYCDLHGIEIDYILSRSKNITKEIFDKHFSSASDVAKINMLKVYNSEDIDINDIIPVLYKSDDTIFKLKAVVNDLKSENSKVFNEIFTSGKEISLLTFLKLALSVNIPKEYQDRVNDLNFVKMDLTQDDEETWNIIAKLRLYFTNIMQRYPVEFASELFKNMYYYAKPSLLDRETLLAFLITCYYIPEYVLTETSEVFVCTGCRDQLVAYGKNYEYRGLLVQLKLLQ